MIGDRRIITACPISCSIVHLKTKEEQTRTRVCCSTLPHPGCHSPANESFKWKELPLADFLVLVSGLHLLVSRRVFSQDVSLFAFKLSILVITWFTHPLHVPFSYRHAMVKLKEKRIMFPNWLSTTIQGILIADSPFLHFFCIVLVCSQDLSPFLRLRVRDRVLVFASHSDHWPFTYLHDEELPDAASADAKRQ